MADPRLRAKIDAREFFVAPGLQDMIAAVTANKVGFDVVYGSGYWTTASAYGLPDTGIVSFTQMLDRMATLVRSSDAAVIADADTGFGGLLNVHHTVRGYEEAGISAIQIEDQEFPKKCGHTPFKRLIPVAHVAIASARPFLFEIPHVLKPDHPAKFLEIEHRNVVGHAVAAGLQPLQRRLHRAYRD